MQTKKGKSINRFGYIKLIRSNSEFRKLWYGQIISLMGDWFNFVASATLIAKLTHSGLAIGALIAVRMLPPFLISPLAGVVADRFNRKHLLILSDLVRAVIVLGFLFVRDPSDVWIIYVLTGCQTLMTGIYFPARNAILPDIVTTGEIGTANALTSTTWSVMLAFGAAMGGIFAGVFGVYAAFTFDSLTFIGSALWIMRLVYVQTTHKKGLTLKSIAEDYAGGLHFLRKNHEIFLAACQKMAFALFMGGAMEVVQVTLARDVYTIGQSGSSSLGIMYAVTGMGTGFGPIFIRSFTGDDMAKIKKAMFWAYMVSVFGLFIMAPLPSFGIYLAGGFLRGFGSGINWVFSSHLLMSLVPGEKRGRVFSMDFAFFTFAHAISTLSAGFLMDQMGFTTSNLMALMAATLWIPGVIWAFRMVRSKHKVTISS